MLTLPTVTVCLQDALTPVLSMTLLDIVSALAPELRICLLQTLPNMALQIGEARMLFWDVVYIQLSALYQHCQGQTIAWFWRTSMHQQDPTCQVINPLIKQLFTVLLCCAVALPVLCCCAALLLQTVSCLVTGAHALQWHSSSLQSQPWLAARKQPTACGPCCCPC
jgi:hypothetical protein